MYRLIIVDDEPASLIHIKTIVEKKCPDYQVTGTAVNGEEALAEIEKHRPDVIISDIKMPVMDGIKLAEQVKARYPDILFIIVSGYQDFDYAKKAIRFGVCDYLLKPLKPADLKLILNKLAEQKKSFYYEKRKALIKAMCHNVKLPEQELAARYFPAGKYYSGIIRKNGLPRRFAANRGIEIFSMEEEQVYLYGRDEMESLYLVSETLLSNETFEEIIQRYFERVLGENVYITGVIHEDKFELSDFPDVAAKLYRKLNDVIVVGKNQLVKSNAAPSMKEENRKREIEILEYVEYLIREKESNLLLPEAVKVFDIWEKNECSQIYIEGHMYYILQLIKNSFSLDEDVGGVEYEIDEAFYYSASMKELRESIAAILTRILPVQAKEVIDDKEQVFYEILAYLNNHMADDITLNGVGRQFGVSQTTLSKWFRLYQDCSFGKYLTTIRIEKAKRIMNQNPQVFIKDVAEHVGYSDQFYFSRIFHSVAGMSPSNFLTKRAQKPD